MCEIESPGGEVSQLKTPVGGQVLELNRGILNGTLDALGSDPYGTGYICVIFPDSELPTFHNMNTWNTAQSTDSGKSNLCFSWQQFASCRRGSSCKFVHEAPASIPLVGVPSQQTKPDCIIIASDDI